MVIAALLVLSLAASGEAAAVEIAGAHIGQSYTELLRQHPQMRCEVSCVDASATLLGHSGNLWAGIGSGKINQLAFLFVPGLTPEEAEVVSAAYNARYGAPSRAGTDGCEEWDRPGGAVVLCLKNGLSFTHWKDANWGVTQSVIPGGT